MIKESLFYLLILFFTSISMLFASEVDGFSPIQPKVSMTKEIEKKFIYDYKRWLKKNKAYYRPAMVWAAVDGQEWLVEMLIRQNELIDVEEQNGGNALSAAIINRRNSIVLLLLEKGADHNFTYSNKMAGVKPIILAAQYGNIKAINLLLDKGANVNYTVPDKYNTTPLYQALSHYQTGRGSRLTNHIFLKPNTC